MRDEAEEALERLLKQQAERIAKDEATAEETFLRHANPLEFVSYAVYRKRVSPASVVVFPLGNADEWEPVQ